MCGESPVPWFFLCKQKSYLLLPTANYSNKQTKKVFKVKWNKIRRSLQTVQGHSRSAKPDHAVGGCRVS